MAQMAQVTFPNLGEKFDGILHKHLQVAVKDITMKLQQTAKEDHRYKHQTRNLRNSTVVTSKESSDYFEISLKADLKKAPYAKFIIRGHGTWDSDPFINNAVSKNTPYINSRIQTAVNSAVDEFNRT